MIVIEEIVSATPGGGALPLQVTLSYALSSTAPPEQTTVTYDLNDFHDVYFANGGRQAKAFTVNLLVYTRDAQQFTDSATLERGSQGTAIEMLPIQQTVSAGAQQLHAVCWVQIQGGTEKPSSGAVSRGGEGRMSREEPPPLAELGELSGSQDPGVWREPARLKGPIPPKGPQRGERPARGAGTRRAAIRRYVNAALVDSSGPRRLSPTAGIKPGQEFRIRLDVGRLSRGSQIERPQPLPQLPGDAWLDVMLASSHFAVGASRQDLGKAPLAHGRFLVPRDSSAAKTPSGSRYLFFWLRAPETARPGPAVARVSFYYRNAVVQSLRLGAEVGGAPWELAIDYTMVEALGDLRLIPERPRLSVLTNDNGGGRHQVTVRSATGDALDSSFSTTFELDERTIGGKVKELRAKLRGIAPLQRRQSRNQLIEDLRQLAPIGRQLHEALAGQFIDAWNSARQAADKLVIQISRPPGGYTLPWGLLYEIYLDSAIEPGGLRVCDLVDQWDGRALLFEGLPRECPHAAEPYHRENVLCPFGFWGLRYSLEQLTKADKPVCEIPATSDPIMAVGLTEYDVDTKELEKHLGLLASALAAGIPNAQLKSARTKQEIRALLGRDLSLVYFYCHGERLNDSDPNTFLGVGRSERITPGDFIGWVQGWLQEKKEIWKRIRPLIFVNACHSVEINPDTLVSYLDAFITTGKAAGLIGTEVKVSQTLAMELATAFFRLFSLPDYSVDRALREVRLNYLSNGNLLGLVYTPYCWADLHLVR